MLYSDQRIDLRKKYFDVWQKHHSKTILEPLELQILQVILEHPEYQYIFADPEKYLDKDFSPKTDDVNPFMHMGLHLGIRDQIATNLPQGITTVFKKLLKKYHGNILEVEHEMMRVLIDYVWQAQNNQLIPSEELLLERLKRL